MQDAYQFQTNSKSYGTLLRQIVDSAKDLIQSEVRLVKTEATDAAKKVGAQSVALSIGSWLLIFSPLAIMASAILGLGEALDGRYWLSSLLVGLVCSAIGGLVAVRAVRKIKEGLAMEATQGTFQDVKGVTRQNAQELSLAVKGGAV